MSVNMIAGHYYALLVNNFTVGANGFTLDFTDQNGVTGTGEFVGPKGDINFTANNPCISGQTFTFSTQPSGASSFKWIFGNTGDYNVVSGSETSTGPVTIRYNSLGNKTVALEVATTQGCQVVNVKNFDVGVTPLTPIITSSALPACTGDMLTLSATSLPDATYAWTGPNNYTGTGQTVRIPITSGAVAGTYSVVITQYGCTSPSGSLNVSPIIVTPTASFTTDPGLPNKLSFPVTVRFTNTSTNSDSWRWDFGDGSTSTERSPEHVYTASGDYDVTLTATNQTACSASTVRGTFVVRAENTLFIPNTFTPNNDGVNDEFVITITNMTNYNLRIYNRWGKLLYQTINIFDNWNGKYEGKDLPVGTYYYLITATDSNRDPVRRSGSVTVIR